MPIESSPRFLLSPPSVALIPILVLHLAIFVYLCRVKKKTIASRWLNGWLTAVMLGVFFMFLGGSVYGPVGGYLELGSLVAFYISIVPSLQFAYHFPKTAFDREARRVLGLSIVMVAACLGWLAVEHRLFPFEYLYSFDQHFTFNPVRKDTGLLAFSILTFDVVYALSLVWLWFIWLRKTVHFTAAAAGAQRTDTVLRQVGAGLAALVMPRGRTARITRAFALVMLCTPLIFSVSVMELWTSLLSGSFVGLYLVVLAGLMLIYINNSSAPTSFMVKLVGISLVTLLIVLGMAIPPILKATEAAYDAVRQSELPYVITLVEDTSGAVNHDRLPDELEYVVARAAPAADELLPAGYQLLFARQTSFDVDALVEEDARLLKATQETGWKASPWLNPDQGLVSLAGGFESFLMPENKRAYRGFYADPAGHYIRYVLRSEDGLTVYEAGFNYLAYRRALHQTGLSLMVYVFGATLLILLVFPHFFRSSLVQPLQALLEGVSRVQKSELDVRVPIAAQDEIGYLTDHFNSMVRSLKTLTENLHAEIGERQRAEAEVRSLNTTLEQRIAYRTRELTTLYEVAAVASQSLNQDALLQHSLERTLVAISADAGAITLLDDNGSGVRRISTGGAGAEQSAELDQLNRLMEAPEISNRMVRQPGPLFVPNVADDPDLRPKGLDPQSYLVTPLRAGGEVMGHMGLVRGVDHAFMLDEIALLTTISQQVAIAVQSSRLRKQSTLHAERERIAHDLHDSVTQSLYGLLMLVENGCAQLQAGESDLTAATLDRINLTARQALKEMRLFIYQLRPPDLVHNGLVGALHLRLSAVEGRANIQTRLLADEGLSLPEVVERTFYWIAQEALNNSLKHAQATSLQIFLRCAGGETIMEIVDNGRGFAPEEVDGCGMGLPGMRERAAQVGGLLEVVSAPGAGTAIRVIIQGREHHESKETEHSNRR